MPRRPRRIAWYVSRAHPHLSEVVREYARHRGLSLSAGVWELAALGLQILHPDEEHGC